jgi:hypothetical protein
VVNRDGGIRRQLTVNRVWIGRLRIPKAVQKQL